MDAFGQWWHLNRDKPVEERKRLFESLPVDQQKILVDSLFKCGWKDLFYKNMVDSLLDNFKRKHGIDLIDMRIKATKYSRVFLIEKGVWENICEQLGAFESSCNLDLIFGGLMAVPWGKNKDFYRVTGKWS